MLAEVLPYLFLLLIGALAAALISSKALSEKLVSAGILPRTFLGFVPILQVVIRVFGAALLIAGGLSMGIQAGWINRDIIVRYGFSAAAIALGIVLLAMSPKRI